MATTKLYLDTRRGKSNGTFPLKLTICKKGKVAQISLGIDLTLAQWDAKTGKVTKHPQKAYINNFIQRRKSDADLFILQLRDKGKLGMYDAISLRNEIVSIFEPNAHKDENLVIDYIVYVREQKKSENTKRCYTSIIKILSEYDANFAHLCFNDFTPQYVNQFICYLREERKVAENSVVAYLRTIKSCFNQAIDEGITTNYPFRRIKVKMTETKKRNLSVEELQYIFAYVPTDKRLQIYIDTFKLQFLLIGINLHDLLCLEDKITKDGRIEYYRSKTKKLYSIKVEKEAKDIINKYHNGTYILPFMMGKKPSSMIGVISYINKRLQQIESEQYDFSNLTSYYSRHSWATIAHSLGISKDTISLALGHSFGTKVTDTYINYDLNKIDEANRKVIDYVLYRKK